MHYSREGTPKLMTKPLPPDHIIAESETRARLAMQHASMALLRALEREHPRIVAHLRTRNNVRPAT